MYGPPLCRKRKMMVTGWSAQMYTAFIGEFLLAMMECAALSSFLSRQSCEDFFTPQVWRAPGLTVESSHCSSADLAGNHNSVVVVAGLRMWESRMRFPSLAQGQASFAGQSGRSRADQHQGPIHFVLCQNGPSDASQFISQRDDGDVGVSAGRQLRQPRSQTRGLLGALL
jgi:hypothetical protein